MHSSRLHSGRRRAPTLLVLCTATTLLIGAQPALARGRSPREIVVSVARGEVGRPIPKAFLGLSTEYQAVPAYAGDDPRAVNPVLVRLIENLAPRAHLMLRIGGDSADRTWWPERGLRRPPGIAYTLSRRWVELVKELLRRTGARVIFDLNLEANDRALASAEAHHLLGGIGRRHIAALEIGNEPEYYRSLPWFHTVGGQAVYGRRPGYDFRTYEHEFSKIRRSLPAVPVAGPATGTVSGWLTHLRSFLGAEPRLAQVTAHRYPLSRCTRNRSSRSYPTVAHLLSSFASRGPVAGIGRYVALTHSRHRLFRVDEMNGVTCGGKEGVSDTFAAALWMLDGLAELARLGVDGVDVHIWPGAPASQLFTFQHPSGRWVGSVRPAYYGLLMFNRALPAGGHLLRVRATNRDGLGCWAIRTPGGHVNVLLINDSRARSQTVLVRPPARASATASLLRLIAPSVYATGHVTLGGQSFGASTATGTLRGAAQVLAVHPSTDGYRLRLPPASAALLTISHR